MKKLFSQKFGPLVLLMYGALVVYYFESGLLAFLVNPIYNKLILSAGIILLLLGLFSLKKVMVEELAKNFSWKKTLLSALLLLPVVMGVLFKPQLLSSASAITRGVSSNLANETFDPTVFSKPTDERTLIEWIRILNVDPEPDHYVGQPVSIEGKIILDESLPKNMFQLGRFVMTCCAADARVIALPIQYDPKLFTPANDLWVTVNGSIKEGTLNDHRQVIVELKSVTSVPMPTDAYEIFK